MDISCSVKVKVNVKVRRPRYSASLWIITSEARRLLRECCGTDQCMTRMRRLNAEDQWHYTLGLVCKSLLKNVTRGGLRLRPWAADCMLMFQLIWHSGAAPAFCEREGQGPMEGPTFSGAPRLHLCPLILQHSGLVASYWFFSTWHYDLQKGKAICPLTIPAPPINWLVCVTNCFYDYDYDNIRTMKNLVIGNPPLNVLWLVYAIWWCWWC